MVLGPIRDLYVAEIWHRGPLWVLEPPAKKRSRFGPFLGHFLMTSLFSTRPSKVFEKGILIVLSERS